MIEFEQTGDFRKTGDFLDYLLKGNLFIALDRYGREGVAALQNATPSRSGETAAAWRYEIKRTRGYTSIFWVNDHKVDGIPLVVLLQYGHGTGTGGYVQGQDFINPALRPIFDKIAEGVWREVKSR